MKHLKLILAVIAFMLFGLSSRAQLAYENSLSISGGAYAASGFGTNAFFGVRYNYFISGGKFFVEGALGIGSLKSQVLQTLTRSQVFDSERLLSYEFVGGFDLYPNSALPFFVAGVAGLNQGGQTAFAGVIGLGKRVPFKGAFGSDQLGFRYDVRDHIFTQTVIQGESFTSHNLALTIGLQFYF